jgi:FkbM family methyltransferase
MAENFRAPRKIARRLGYLPRAMKKIRNWPTFMWHYALGLVPRNPYVFRNGAQLVIRRGIDHVPIIEIFLNEEYGRVPDRAVVLDLGANIGVFTVYATTTARDVRLYAYEPWPEFGAALQDNVRLNQQDKAVRFFDYAVASESGTRTLDFGGETFFFPTFVGASDTRGKGVQVRSTTLEEIIDSNQLAQIDFLKMDCEGAEYEILYSTPSSYLQRIRQIRMEYHNLDMAERQVDALKQFLVENGFVLQHQHATSENNGTLWVEREEKPFSKTG